VWTNRDSYHVVCAIGNDRAMYRTKDTLPFMDRAPHRAPGWPRAPFRRPKRLVIAITCPDQGQWCTKLEGGL